MRTSLLRPKLRCLRWRMTPAKARWRRSTKLRITVVYP
uniref:Uncharacterized protein n=1 Tax=Zea mays TaxID=4577 RepID=B8A1B6_MAIZE|nr:unknown [Zea mays]